MAALSHPTLPSPSPFSDPNTRKNAFRTARFPSRHAPPSPRDAALCRCQGAHSDSPSPSSGNSSSAWTWNSALQDAFRAAVTLLDSFVNSYKNQPEDAPKTCSVKRHSSSEDGDDDVWDWERWKKLFLEVDEQERMISVLKSQLSYAILKEEYKDAARLKVAIAAAASSDIVGRVIYHLNRAINEERYKDAALIRDSASAGLVGWWAGISDDTGDPYGQIIHISAEHGRYIARSYSPRQLATSTSGVPLFEIFLRMTRKGGYKHQAVYLKRRAVPQVPSTISSMSLGATSSINSLRPSDSDRSDALTTVIEDEDGEDRDDDSELLLEPSSFQDVLQDMIPGMKVKVLKVTIPERADRDLISKVVEQIIEDEDDAKDSEQESTVSEDGSSSESDEIQDDFEFEASSDITDNEERNEIAFKVFVGGPVQNPSGSSVKDLERVPAKLIKKGRSSFSFTIEEDDNRPNSIGKEQPSLGRRTVDEGLHNISRVLLDLDKSIGRGKLPLKVLKDVGELINLTLVQALNRQPLSGLTTFNRIDVRESPDPLNGLYIGARGLYTSEVIYLQRKFGQWQESGETKESLNLEFYEYVEALKLTGDPNVPAGQVAFRAKVGKRNQLPHRGIIPEEFGVIARYRGQGRVADPGFRNPRWVDGELVILDGKFIRGGPAVGFVYWAPDYQFLVFFHRLRLQE